ncbi:hypothetical protein HMPREF3216_01310 [Gardnerella vaginalis]|uniref:Uncharacterized protein n=1 Tax=Gardnerella vaginalis TaxID=2702 RepID=A0A133NM92_GARVA|nr:hypothetical protein HMPREF3216_01310 [Gardnerella vaginalis]
MREKSPRLAEPLRQKHCFCAAKTFARVDRANDDLHFRFLLLILAFRTTKSGKICAFCS